MEPLPDDVANLLVRAMGAYIRASPAQELTAPLRPYKKIAAPKALAARREALLKALDDQATRGRMLEWLEEDKPSLTAAERDVLKLACERPEGWHARLTTLSQGPKPGRVEAVGPGEERGERQIARLRDARDEARKERDDARAQARLQGARAAELERDVARLREEVRRAGAELEAAQADTERARAELERERRRARRDSEQVKADKARLQAEVRDLRAELRQARREVEAVQRKLEAQRRKARGDVEAQPSYSWPRKPLVVPKGLLETAPETLEQWLDVEGARLLVDGYNVAKAPGGYGELELADQRDRVIDEVARLARRKKVEATIVFDGSVVPPGTARRARASVRVEYSKPGEEGDRADDHLIAFLSELPPLPVVFVTSDRALQRRAARLGATIATSEQLLALFR